VIKTSYNVKYNVDTGGDEKEIDKIVNTGELIYDGEIGSQKCSAVHQRCIIQIHYTHSNTINDRVVEDIQDRELIN
jgi:hypothetical protein